MNEKVTHLYFTDAELKVLNDALMLAPFGVVYPVMMTINKQISEQNAPKVSE